MIGTEHPTRRRVYNSFITDTRIWKTFALRPDDIVVSTPPKCGTTWMQTLIAMMIHGPAAAGAEIRTLSPWLDCAFRDPPTQAALLAAQSHRRCIKSHAPLDGIAYDPRASYIAVYRHPVDVHFSMRRHVENINPGFMDDLLARFPDDVAEAFAMFLDDRENDAGTDRMTLEGLVLHYRSFRDWAHLPNIHLFHYADMSRDLPRTVSRLAALLGIDLDGVEVAEIAEAGSFGAMKAAAASAYDGKADEVFVDRAAFFDSGSSGKWVGRLSDDLLARYRARMDVLLPAEDIAWLQSGGALPH